MGFDTEGDNVPPFIMNGMGLPGGAHTLEEVFIKSGIEAVAAQFNKTVPVMDAQANEEPITHIVNIGGQGARHVTDASQPIASP